MDKVALSQELKFKAMRSSGAGGQHVNKVSTKVELLFSIADSSGLTVAEKELVFSKLSNKINKEAVLILQCDDTRSQARNKEIAIKRFFELLKSALTIPKKRKKTTPTRASVEKRLSGKRKISEKKSHRKKPDL